MVINMNPIRRIRKLKDEFFDIWFTRGERDNSVSLDHLIEFCVMVRMLGLRNPELFFKDSTVSTVEFWDQIDEDLKIYEKYERVMFKHYKMWVRSIEIKKLTEQSWQKVLQPEDMTLL